MAFWIFSEEGPYRTCCEFDLEHERRREVKHDSSAWPEIGKDLLGAGLGGTDQEMSRGPVKLEMSVECAAE